MNPAGSNARGGAEFVAAPGKNQKKAKPQLHSNLKRCSASYLVSPYKAKLTGRLAPCRFRFSTVFYKPALLGIALPFTI
jgi:hypothetical protein